MTGEIIRDVKLEGVRGDGDWGEFYTVGKSQAGMWGSTMDRARVGLLEVAAWMVG